MSRRKPTHPCPIPECTTLRDANQIFCAKHWFKVPKRIREEIFDAWREWSDKRTRDAMARYRAARAAAFQVLGAVEA